MARAVQQRPDARVIILSPCDIPLTYDFPARVLSYRRIEVRPRIEGIIRERLFEEGAVVDVGQLLYRIEPARYEAALRAAEARVVAAKARNDRYGPLVAEHAVAQQEADNARMELESARAQMAQAQQDFDDTFVRAELRGRIGRTTIDIGGRVTGPGDLLTTIDQLDPVYLDFHPSSNQVSEWSASLRARRLTSSGRRLGVEAIMSDGTVLARLGRLDFVAPSVDPATGTQNYRALFANPDLALVPGQFVRARLIGFTLNRALVVPVRAVHTTLGRQFVYVLADGDTVRVRDIETSAWDGNQWVVRRGLRNGDRVVVDGGQKLIAGHPVHPVLMDARADAPSRDGA